MVSPRARRDQVRFLRERGLSQRRAWGLLGVPRSTMTYRLRQPAKDESPIAAMHRLSSHYPRYGYRRIRIFLRREGLVGSEPHPAAVAASRFNPAPQTTAATDCQHSAAAVAAAGAQSRLGPTTSCSTGAPMVSS